MRTITEESDDHYGLTDDFGVITINDHTIRVYRRVAPGSETVRGFELSSEEAELLKDWLNEHIHIKSEYKFVSDQEDRPWNKTW